MRLVYLHGFNSSPASHKAQVLKAYLEARGLGACYACPALPPRAGEAVEEIERLRPDRETCLVGSSLGGYYATHVAEKHGCRAVLINPAIDPHTGLQAYLGPQANLHTGAPYELTRAHLEAWRALWVGRIDPERYLLLLETGDELLDWRRAVARYEGARMAIRQGGDHTLQSFPEHLERILAFARLPVRA
ncbi:MAG TPA: YqiA/YcfP family alpha/beta fold hydrolase [Burkholderiales bacterium]|nr:YqiA/YcfP family alpha/beta fold hydrolase [Burkholderiales bacterium]